MPTRKPKPPPQGGNKEERKRTPRTNATEAELRVTAVYEYLLGGYSRADILQFAAKQWGLERRQTDTYIKRAREIIIATQEANRDYYLAESMLRLNKLYAQAFKVQDWKTCLAVQREIAALQGLHAPNRHEVSGAGGGPLQIVFTEAEIDIYKE
jgi:hypothetical protein